MKHPASLPAGATRRDFLAASAATAAGAALTALAPSVHAAGGDTLRVGLIGCGGRGTGAATQALRADPNVQLVAVGDAFEDRAKASLDQLRKDEEIAAKVQVKPENVYVGFDAYKGVLASGVDVVLLTTPPGFRPLHLKAAVEAGKHIFCEKPVAVDAPGLRSVLATCAEAKKKNLSLVSGLCYRYEHAKRETMKRVHDGQIGDIVALQCSYNTGALWHKPRQSAWSDMEWQLRNWLYFTWLSGDHIVEQAIHSLDKMAWAMKDVPPLKAVGTGGRQSRTGPEFGHIFDHFAIVYQYPGGVKLFHYCRQQAGTKGDVSDHIMGTEGTCEVMTHRITDRITGKDKWRHVRQRGTRTQGGRQRRSDDMYQNEHDELFASIRSGKPINNGEYMSRSTLMAIMGRMAAYTGQEITWEMALNSKENLTPAKYEFGPLAVAPVARPGYTKFA